MANKTTSSTSNMESNTGNALLGKKNVKGYASPISLHIHSVRKRLTDPDGVSAKAVIDGIVKAGLLPDDSARYIEEITFSQEKGEPEKTIITAWA